MLSEEQIIKRCLKNDRQAQKAIYEKYSSVLMGICVRYLNNTFEAEEVLQDGFVKIFSRIKQFSGRGPFINWMKKIMINTAITHYYKNLKHQHHYDFEEINEMDIAGKTFDSSDFTREELLNVIKKLPDGYRIVFNLYAIEGYKHKDIAELLEIDINTSKSQYSRARKLVQKKLFKLNKISRTDNE